MSWFVRSNLILLHLWLFILAFTSGDLTVSCESDELTVEEGTNAAVECFATKPVNQCVWVKVESVNLHLQL
jgi:hypothetical protein